jgi:hypothetical protein
MAVKINYRMDSVKSYYISKEMLKKLSIGWMGLCIGKSMMIALK